MAPAQPMDAHKANAIKSKAPLRPSRALRSAMARRGRAAGTITYFFSAKNDRDIVLASDLEFAHALLLEADETVKAYDADPERVIAFVEREGYLGSKPDAVVTLWSGRTRYVEVKYVRDQGSEHAQLQAEVQKRAADAVGAQWSWFTDEHARAKLRLLHDWQHVAPVLAQARLEVKARWEYLADWVLTAAGSATTLGELQRDAQDPWDLVFATTFRLVQMGRLRTDLESKPISPATVVAPREPRYA